MICLDNADVLHYWDTQTGRLLRTPRRIDMKAGFLASAPDGRTMAVAARDTNDGLIRLIDISSNRADCLLRGHNGHLDWHLVWSPDGGQLASSALDNTVRVWDAQSGALRHTLSLSRCHRIAWSPDGKRLAGVSPPCVRVWEAETGRLLFDLSTPSGRLDGGLAWSPNGRLWCSTGDTPPNNFLWIWEDASSPLPNSPRIPKGMQNGNRLSISPDGRAVALASYGGMVQTWDAATAKPLHTLPSHTSVVRCVSFSSDGQTISRLVAATLGYAEA